MLDPTKNLLLQKNYNNKIERIGPNWKSFHVRPAWLCRATEAFWVRDSIRKIDYV